MRECRGSTLLFVIYSRCLALLWSPQANAFPRNSPLKLKLIHPPKEVNIFLTQANEAPSSM